ncbi:MAG: glucosamine-6-phosphate deaminase [Clostridiales bacterium]|nr:glucosamine-6-phosphate deaminase [Clostridiales bacterium]
MRCNCPYIVCPVHGNCTACIARNRARGDMAHCMEKTAMKLGAVMPLRLPKEVFLENDYEAMSRRSAELVCDVIREKPDALVCLPAGNTAIRTYEIMREMAVSGAVDFSRVHFVALDEWLDLEDESENCDAFMRRHFYGPLNIPDEQVTRFDIHASDLQSACKAVDEDIRARGGIDVMLLGLGMNGHLGLNEPNSDFKLYSKVVELDDTTRSVGQKYFSDGMALSRGITLGVHHMFETGKVILQVSGSHKAGILEKVIRSAPTEEIPATVLKLLPHGVIITDRDAAANVLDVLDK